MLLLVMLSTAVAAQDVAYTNPQKTAKAVHADFPVKGVVKDATGLVSGATVTEKGTNNATTTDKNGKFSLNLKNFTFFL